VAAEEAAAEGDEERAEDDLGAAGLGKSHPQNESKLEGIVEGEPVDRAHGALKHRKAGKDHPVGEPLRIVGFGSTEQRGHGVVAGNSEADDVDEELAADVEKDEEEVRA